MHGIFLEIPFLRNKRIHEYVRVGNKSSEPSEGEIKLCLHPYIIVNLKTSEGKRFSNHPEMKNNFSEKRFTISIYLLIISVFLRGIYF